LHVFYGGLWLCISSMFIDQVECYEMFVNEFVPGGVEVVYFL
jgi:hypothetical protein